MNGKRHLLLVALRTPEPFNDINKLCVPAGYIGEGLWDRSPCMSTLALQ